MDRFNSLNTFLKDKFGSKVYKVSLSAGLSCPNRDGSKGSAGCIYCNPLSNQPFIVSHKPVKDQLLDGIEYVKKRHGASKYISYFQHFSNTYGDTTSLGELYEDAIAHPNVVGLAISTRPDCISPETLKLLKRLKQKVFLWVELGLQSAKDETLKFLNREHSVGDFEDVMQELNSADIMTCAHIILGLPNETHDDMMATIGFLALHKVGGVKIHNLHILKDTPLAEMYARGEIKTLELKEYASLVVDCLERLPKNILIHRFNSHSPRDLSIAPKWSINKLATMNAVNEELERRDTFQGRLA